MPTATIPENILMLICGIGILQGILLSALIFFHRRSDKSVNKFLSLYIISITAVMIMPLTMNLVGWQNSYFIQPLPVLPPVFLYLYILSFKEKITWKKAYPHFIIFFVILLLSYKNMSAIAALYPNTAQIPAEAFQRPFTIFIVIVKTTQHLAYYFGCRKALSSYQRSIQGLFSDTSRIDLRWVRFLLNGLIVLIGAFLVLYPLMIKFPEYFDALLLLNMAVATPYIYITTFKGILQPTIWQIQPKAKKEIKEEKIVAQTKTQTTATEISRTSKAKLSPAVIDEIKHKLKLVMEQDKLFLESELTLQQLSEKLSYPTYQVSQAINEGMKKSFYDLINGYRVEKAKQLLLDPKNSNYTILSVGFEAGFNSKTTFNTVFKKFTGFSPTEFRVNMKPGVAAI